MTTSPDEQVVFRDYPIWFWLSGLICLVPVGLGFDLWMRVVFLLLAVICIGFASVLTVTVDHKQKTLNLHYRSLFRAYTRSYPLSEIGLINVSEDNEKERMYRWELVLLSGEVVPFRTFYMVGRRRKERRAQRLRAAIQSEHI